MHLCSQLNDQRSSSQCTFWARQQFVSLHHANESQSNILLTSLHVKETVQTGVHVVACVDIR